MNEQNGEKEVAFRVLVEGRVTGVGFRWSALSYARKLPDLKGYISNVTPGCVEALVQGPQAQVDSMLEWLKTGPSYARVDSYKCVEYPLNEYLTIFGIK
ncbi:MAG: acylphosphatase [Lentisphaerae bacterium]|nr:acylphosphatase [Lentisphaerota bacterium]MCP4103234.1 acylphosphatase [Lentisphaerota bacterium]